MNYGEMTPSAVIEAWEKHPKVLKLNALGPEVSTEEWFGVLLAIPRDLRQAYLHAIQVVDSEPWICAKNAIGLF